MASSDNVGIILAKDKAQWATLTKDQRVHRDSTLLQLIIDYDALSNSVIRTPDAEYDVLVTYANSVSNDVIPASTLQMLLSSMATTAKLTRELGDRVASVKNDMLNRATHLIGHTQAIPRFHIVWIPANTEYTIIYGFDGEYVQLIENLTVFN